MYNTMKHLKYLLDYVLSVSYLLEKSLITVFVSPIFFPFFIDQHFLYCRSWSSEGSAHTFSDLSEICCFLLCFNFYDDLKDDACIPVLSVAESSHKTSLPKFAPGF